MLFLDDFGVAQLYVLVLIPVTSCHKCAESNTWVLPAFGMHRVPVEMAFSIVSLSIQTG